VGRKAPNKVAVCTVVSKNYISHARVLANSFKRHHPDITFYVLLADRLDGYFDPQEEEFELVEVEELSIPNPNRFRFHYNVLEHDTAVKPYFFSHLFKKFSLDKLIYFDPDILVLSNLDPLFALVDGNSVVLTPHTTVPYNDELEPTELTLLLAGTFNLGFIGMSNTAETQQFLEWWEKRLYSGCLMERDKGMHVDQKWMDLVPSYFDGVHILKEPGYNVAYWNLHSRKLRTRYGQVFANDQPCYFFHFSGMEPGNVARVSKYQNRLTLRGLGATGERLFKDYSRLLLAAGYHETKKWPYAFARFDNGVRIPDAVRRLYLEMSDDAERFGNPFETKGKDSFFNWLVEPVDGEKDPSRVISRMWYEVYKLRPDLRALFPDIFGVNRDAFLQWAAASSDTQLGIEEGLRARIRSGSLRSRPFGPRHLIKKWLATFAYVAEPVLKPLLKGTVGRNDRLWQKLRSTRDALQVDASPPPVGRQASLSRRLYASSFHLFGPPSRAVLDRAVGRNSMVRDKLRAAHNRLMLGGSQAAMRSGAAPAAASRNGRSASFGVNLSGYLTSEKGMGESARSYVRSLEAAGLPYVLDNLVDASAKNADASYSGFSTAYPHAVNLIDVNADQAANFAWLKGEQYYLGRYNIGVWTWEVSHFPDEWVPNLKHYDEIWVPSKFVADSVGRLSFLPVLRMPHSINPDQKRNDAEAAFNLDPNKFHFLFMFDFHSVFERKNPMGVIDAFKRAFSPSDPVKLLIKSSRCTSEAVDRMREAALGADVEVVDKVISKEGVNSLYHLTDCYVSLHRSEGFGLTIAEAMLAAKPVIATAYSGNTDFTTPGNSYLVRYDIVELTKDCVPYKRGWQWAEPDLDHAAELMRHVYEHRDQALATGARAREDILRTLHPDVVGEQLKSRLMRIAAKKGIALPGEGAMAGAAEIPRKKENT